MRWSAMKRKLFIWLAAAVVFGLPSGGFATGNLLCSADDENMTFEVEAIFSYSDIGGLFQLAGTLNSRLPATYDTLRRIDIVDADLKQQWFRGDVLKLMLYRETDGEGVPHAAVRLIVEAERSADDELTYVGKYRLTVEPAVEGGESLPVTVEGDMACEAG